MAWGKPQLLAALQFRRERPEELQRCRRADGAERPRLAAGRWHHARRHVGLVGGEANVVAVGFDEICGVRLGLGRNVARTALLGGGARVHLKLGRRQRVTDRQRTLGAARVAATLRRARRGARGGHPQQGQGQFFLQKFRAKHVHVDGSNHE
eukprot:5824606-Prymnesium_polylepis.1